jgi:uncharacterized protein (TIGR00255 family)
MADLRSMTGFARVRRALAEGELVVAVKSVNHRGLDVQVHAPTAADPWETTIRALVKARVSRGHVEVRVSLPHSAGGTAIALNRALLDQYVGAFRDAASAHGISAQPDLNFAFRQPGILSEPGEQEPPPGCEAALVAALEEALDKLNEFRTREGSEIGTELRGHNARIHAAAEEMERIRSRATAAFQARLNDRLHELLNGVAIEPQRLAQEVAILTDRSDIGEELARLKIHSGQLGALLDAGGETGKRLDFLLQEMNRETNTILSKTSGVGETGLRITELALDTKAAIEKIREQSLNLE